MWRTDAEVAAAKFSRPRIGWLQETDYTFSKPRIGSVELPQVARPSQTTHALLSVPPRVTKPLGNIPDTIAQHSFSAIWLSIPRSQTSSVDLLTDKVAQDSLALLGEPETTELRYEIGKTSELNCFSSLAFPQKLSGDLNCALTLPKPIETRDCTNALFLPARVSDDLHKPLIRPPRISGKQYSAEEKDLDKPSEPKLMSEQEKIEFRKALAEANRTNTRRVFHGAGIWDLLLPLLQRPINLNLGMVVDLPSNLYGFQTKGVEFLLDTQTVLLGDDMGTGKTVQAAVAMRILFQTGKVRTALIVCPLSVIPNWGRELEKWAGNLGVKVVRGGKEHRKECWRQPAHIWLTTFETLRNDLEDVAILRKGRFGLIVVDEAQRIKNRNAGVSKAVRELRSNYRWGLTGTPLENHLEDVFSIFEFVKPGLFESRDYHPQEVQSVIKPYFLRRRKQDVLTDLPPLVQNPVWLRLEDEQRKSYDELEEQGVLELHAKGEKITAQNILVLIGKLKQVCNRCPRTGESSKMAWLRDSLDDVTAEGDKALVFSQYVDEKFAGADWIESELADFGTLNYSKATSDKKRREMLADFSAKPEHKVFVGHPKTAGLGLNELVAANYVIHFDHWWNPAVMNQATARAHRPGQKKATVFAYDLWIEDTYEEIIFAILKEKQGLYNEVIDSMSAELDQQDKTLVFAVFDRLLEKRGLQPTRRAPRAAG